MHHVASFLSTQISWGSIERKYIRACPEHFGRLCASKALQCVVCLAYGSWGLLVWKPRWKSTDLGLRGIGQFWWISVAKTLRHLRPSILVFSHSLVSCGFQDGVGLVRKNGTCPAHVNLGHPNPAWVAISSGWTFAVPGRTTIFHRYPGYHVPCLIRWIKRTSGMSIYTNNYKHIMTYHDPVVCVAA